MVFGDFSMIRKSIRKIKSPSLKPSFVGKPKFLKIDPVVMKFKVNIYYIQTKKCITGDP